MKFCITVLLLFTPAFLLPSNVSAHEASADRTIVVNDTGFTPTELSIHVGDTVTFINEGKNPHWPASDLHPTHAVYSEFDPKRALTPGEHWEFTFDKPGKWNFHDHEAPTFVGFIDVAPKDGQAVVEEKDELTFTLGERIKMFVWRLLPFLREKAYADMQIFPLLTENPKETTFWIQTVGSSTLMEKLVSESNGGTTKDCHQEAHILGRLSYKVEHERAFAGGSADCHSGFYHGAMEGLLKEKGTENLAARIDEICNNFKTSFGVFECLHGVGHGVMAFTGYNLPNAITTCQDLETDFAKSSCYGGVFMENIIAGAGDAEHKTTWLSEDPHYPCNKISTDFPIQYECYQMQTSRMLTLFDYDFQMVSKECLKANEDMVPTCFQSFGRDAAGFTLRDPKKTLALCEYVPKEHYDSCIRGAIQVVVDFWGENIKEYPYAFCEQVENADAKDKCFEIVFSRLPGLFGTDQKRIKESCIYAKDLEKLCLTANNVSS